MDTPITFETSYKWTLSIGTFLLILSLGIPLFKQLTTDLMIVTIILITVAVILINQSLTEMKKIEDAARRYKQELTVSEIIKPDLLLMDKEFKELEYNQKVKDYNQTHDPKMGGKQFRKIESIVHQALDPEFYEKTYGIDKKQKGGNQK